MYYSWTFALCVMAVKVTVLVLASMALRLDTWRTALHVAAMSAYATVLRHPMQW